MERDNAIKTVRSILLAGLAGGMAEILCISAYSNVQSASGTAVARQVTASLWPAAGEWAFAPALGIIIHLALSIALAAMAAPLLSRIALKHPGAGFIVTSAAFLLVLVWTVNFFIILPMLNPAFVTLLPYSVSFASKLLFGITMGVVWCHRPRRQTAAANHFQ